MEFVRVREVLFMSAVCSLSGLAVPRLSGRVDRRSIRIAVLMVAVAVLNVVDLVYTVFANGVAGSAGPDLFHEVNPLGAAFLQLGLVPSLVCFKILMVGCGLGLLWKVRRSRWVVPACWLLLAVYVGLSVMWWMWVSDASQAMEMRLTL